MSTGAEPADDNGRPIVGWDITNHRPAVPEIDSTGVDTNGVVYGTLKTSSGSSGGAVTIADGANIAQGQIADAAVTGDNPGTVGAKLRGFSKMWADIWDSINHRIRVDGSGVTQPVSQGAGAAMGTSWRVMGDYAEQVGLSAAALNADLVPSTDVSAYPFLALQIAGTYTGTLSWQYSNDQVTWLSSQMCLSTSINPNNIGSGTSTTGTLWLGARQGRYFRVRMSGYSSGTATGTLELSTVAPPFLLTGVNATIIPTTSGGTSDYHAVSLATNNAANIKSSAGQVYGWDMFNNAATVRYVKLYNKATAPVPGTDTPVRTIAIPAGQKAFNTVENGMAFSAGIGIAIVAGIADSDNTAISLNDVVLDLDYK